MDGALNFGLWGCLKFAHSPCLSLRERYLPKGGGEGCADSGWRDAVSHKELVRLFCGKFRKTGEICLRMGFGRFVDESE